MLTWRKSSFSSPSGNCVEVAWRKSSFTTGGNCVEIGWRASTFSTGGNCVEVAHQDPGVLIRDSKNPDGPVLDIPVGRWAAFLRYLR